MSLKKNKKNFWQEFLSQTTYLSGFKGKTILIWEQGLSGKTGKWGQNPKVHDGKLPQNKAKKVEQANG